MATILIDKLLQTQVNRNASDLHIAVGQPPVLRVDGRLVRLDTKTLEPEDTTALMKSISPERCQQELQEVGGSDFGFAFGDQARFRVSIFKQKGYVGMVLRLIPVEMMTFEKLGTPPVLTDLIMRPRGLILVTGPTGSGKTTTLASAVDYLNQAIDRHIITIEQDPDVILVGEMRDLETIEAAITAAETGHIVFGTLHTTGAQGTINRIIDVFPTNQQEQIRTQLSVAVIGILSQALLPRIGGGRVAAYEMLVVTPAISNLIRENKVYRINSAIQTGHKLGMQLLDDHMFKLWESGVVEEEDVLILANSPDELRLKIARAKKSLLEDEEESQRRMQKGK